MEIGSLDIENDIVWTRIPYSLLSGGPEVSLMMISEFFFITGRAVILRSNVIIIATTAYFQSVPGL